ncbi:MAG: hypothetical protein D3924_13500, partial [Candidatus Electrothrix sp. AR4]|nr:hypothetical protein [Candidatus Electrothrix sp. AR4]
VLHTDHGEIPKYKGTAWRDGVQVSRRLSTSGFDFADQEGQPPGSMLMEHEGNTLLGGVRLEKTHPTNPFLHRYHPDHDNLNDRYEEFAEDVAQEVPDISRAIQMDFTTAWGGEPDAKPPGWGETFLEGVYSEIISGLHKNEISIKGDFTLRRVSEVDVLNP